MAVVELPWRQMSPPPLPASGVPKMFTNSSKELTVNQKIKARFKEGQVIAQVVEHVDET